MVRRCTNWKEKTPTDFIIAFILCIPPNANNVGALMSNERQTSIMQEYAHLKQKNSQANILTCIQLYT